MKVNLHIDRLVIEGLPVGRHEGPRIEAAVEAELARLIGEWRPDEPASGRSALLVRAPPILRPSGKADQLGVQIAQAVYEGISV